MNKIRCDEIAEGRFAIVRLARPAFLYTIYILLLAALPIGVLAAISHRSAADAVSVMTAYFRGIPSDLYTLFGTAYLGYTAARTLGKIKGVE